MSLKPPKKSDLDKSWMKKKPDKKVLIHPELPTDWYAWMHTAHHDNPQILDYINKFVKTNPNEEYIARRIEKIFPDYFYLY